MQTPSFWNTTKAVDVEQKLGQTSLELVAWWAANGRVFCILDS